MADQPLSDVKVLDLTWHIAGPYCTKLLADYGAEVIKVERPGSGDPARSMGPFFKDDPHPEKSGLFLHLNTSKRGITLNLKSDTGKKIFKELVKGVDILVESFRPHVMPGLGLSYEELEKINPRLVMTSISNFGQTGPYRDFRLSELVLSAMGTGMFFQGIPEREPVKLGGTVIQFQVGNIAAVATVFSLYGSEIRGTGEHLDVAALETQLGSIDRRGAGQVGFQYTGRVDIRAREDTRASVDYPRGAYPCKDGWIDIVGITQFFPRVAQMLGMPELAKDPRFSGTNLINQQSKEEFDAIFIPWCAERTRAEVWTTAQKAHVLSGVINSMDNVVNDPHFNERHAFTEVDHAVVGKLKYPGAPFRMSETPWRVRRPAPLLGQHNEEVYERLGYSREDMVKLRETGVI
jgi:crotonobetainyl-CoA:carnitine CoA-transferase CaiB-like acyl-CoA transferase